jgi:hypothetical protein
MVPPVKLALALLLLFGFSARAELLFTFQSQESDLDGVKLHQLVFLDGGKQVSYAPPRGWQYFGDDNTLRLTPPHGQPGEAIVTKVKLIQPQKFDEATMKRLSDEVVVSAPSGSRRTHIVTQEKDHLLIEGKETFLVVVGFELYGVTQMRSVLFLNRNADQIRFQFTCPEANFTQLQKQFLASQFTWQNL